MGNEKTPTVRNYQPGDEQDWLALLDDVPDFAYNFFNQSPSLDVLRMVVEHPVMDAALNLFFAELGGHFAGYAELWCAEGKSRAVGRLLVHPKWRRRKLGTKLLARIEGRARVIGSHYLDIAVAAQHKGGRRFLEAHGFHIVHYSWHMVMPDLAQASAPDWPEGYQTRTFVPGQDEHTSAQLENACFADVWEYVPVEVGEFEGFVRSPSFHADGVIYATHQGQVVGECWSWMQVEQRIAPETERHGDVWCLCVHPQHRRRGLGRALLLAGVQWLRQQGARAAFLAVDGANEEALHLYESAGFVTRRTDVWYRKGLQRQTGINVWDARCGMQDR